MNRFRNVVVSLDQLGNAITRGNPDSTISARTGYNAHFRASNFWLQFQHMVNWAFFVLDGEGHCWQAYEADSSELFFDAAWYDKVLLVVLSAPVCLAVGVITRVWRYCRG